MNIHVFTFLQYFKDQETYKTSCQMKYFDTYTGIFVYWFFFFILFCGQKKNAFYQLLILQYDAKIR